METVRDNELDARILNIKTPWRVADVELNPGVDRAWGTMPRC